MILRHCKRNPIHARWQVIPKQVFVAWLFACTLWGSGQSVYSQILPSPSSSAKSAVGLIVAQGRLQPTKGVLKLSVPPGDRIEKILVEPGAQVGLGDSLAVLESARLKKLELELAQLKLTEAIALHRASLREAQLAIDTANLKFRSAEQMQKQAQANLELVSKQSKILQSLDDQIHRLEAIRANPRLQGAVGAVELEAKRNQKINAQAEYDRSYLGSDQAAQTAADLLAQAALVVQTAQQAKADLESNPGYRTLEKQIELLEIQLEFSTLKAPSPGTILQVSAIAGERASNLPILEMADLSEMSCVAEVHESDVGLVRIGQTAEMKSASLPRTLRGKVSRIDRVVGAPQIRSPNPLARSDFRSIAVWIQVAPEDAATAAQRVQLQVEVSITP